MYRAWCKKCLYCDSCQLLLYFIEYITRSGTYKKDLEGPQILFPMAEQRPTQLDEYCKQLNISFFELKLKCIFCKFTVELNDLADFYCKNLSLIWKDSVCYACCKQCILLSAKYEQENFTTNCVDIEHLSQLVHVPLKDIVVRCVKCYRRLDTIEKIDCKARGEKALLIRGYWRAKCRYCYKS